MSRCTGHCCRDFHLPVSPMELEFQKKRQTQLGSSRFGSDILKIANMVIYRFSAKFRGVITNRYTCKNYNKETGDCMDYENRPRMCSEYPYGKVCDYKDCTYKCEAS